MRIFCVLVILGLSACQGAGGDIQTYASSGHVPTAAASISDRLNQTQRGQSYAEFNQIFPEITEAGTENGMVAYEILIQQEFYIEGETSRTDTTVYGGNEHTTTHRRPLHRFSTRFWFIFYDDKYLGMVRRNRWPSDPEGILSGAVRLTQIS